MTKTRIAITKITIFAMFLALGWLLPLLTGQIPEIGSMLLPMHIPVIIGGFVLGPYYGLILGIVTPLTRTLIFGMPPIYTISLSMSAELGIYGLTSGLFFNLLYRKAKLNLLLSIYITLISAMILGRAAWGITRYFMGLSSPSGFTFSMFLAGAFLTAYPGIILQLILIPAIIFLLEKLNILDKYMIYHEDKKDDSNN